MIRSLLLLAAALPLLAADPPAYRDRTYPSALFNGPRSYRLFLPPGYETSPSTRYPVIYYFHGHSDRYTLERYDEGKDTVPKIAAFVRENPVIVVAMDGYVARDYTGFYGGSPYDVRIDGGEFDFGIAFTELYTHIDSTLRTIADRRHRATSGLSMGGFLSLMLSARFPDRIGSASSFNPGPEFYAGEKGRRSLWRPKDHTANHEPVRIRLIRASGDYISQYHEETRAAYARAAGVDFEFRQDEYHRHWATSIGETFAFHARAFADPALDAAPAAWTYTSPFARFSAWGYAVEANPATPALLTLEKVTPQSLAVRSRRWAPDGPAAACSSLTVSTAPLYRPGARYTITSLLEATGAVSTTPVTAAADGRLTLALDCAPRQIAIAGPGLEPAPLLVLPLPPRAAPTLSLRVFNPRATPVANLRAVLSSAYPTVTLPTPERTLPALPAASLATLEFPLTAAAAGPGWEHARLEATLTADGLAAARHPIDLQIAPAAPPAPLEVVVLDGRTQTFSVFRQKGNQGGGAPITRTVTEGTGNGDGRLDPGEQATLWLRYPAGLDPLDRGNWCRAKVASPSPLLTEIGDIQEEKQREWTGAMNRTSLLALSPDAPRGARLPVLLDCETWSFHFTPDVRYGRELLYQAFQFHRHDLYSYQLPVAP